MKILKNIVCVLLIIQTLDCVLTQNVTINANGNPLNSTDEDFPKEFAPTWQVNFEEKLVNVSMKQSKVFQIEIVKIDPNWGPDFELHILPGDMGLIRLSHNIITAKDLKVGQTSWKGNFTMEGILLGRTPVYVELRRPNQETETAAETMDVIILRKIDKLDVAFRTLVGGFVMLLYVNFGAALELDALKRILLKPIGPAIGFVGQFLIMPILSFSIGYFLFRDMIELRLGLFFTGSTPGGGASNIFTVLLSGNLNLSITMTAISNLLAFGMMPLWIFTLGALIFEDGNLIVPYKMIASMSFSLVLPLCIGIGLQKFAPNFAKKMIKVLKPLALIFVVGIMGFSFTVNTYIYKLFSWKILIASSALSWLGYLLGWVMAKICRQSSRDAITIAIETGIQNIGIAIFMLNFTLPQPQADMTSAVPMANSMMTPIPLLIIYLIKKIFFRNSNKDEEEKTTEKEGIKYKEVEAIMVNDKKEIKA
ncbi:hepatic sodium/bile acid cotransporter-like [Musca vetustissima]|uniref:hepatic sodium/bile acid cotransporter-like n=1 Tax=Musca vetustissima TaxID=27455 RepID=UPI002AB6E9C8|nr:hepatic sodium/bile acid cotransporter-like [Musca vetustissima]